MWFWLSLSSAFLSSAQNVFFKHPPIKVNAVITAWSVLVVSALLYIPFFFLGIPKLTHLFWIAVGIRLLIDSLAFSLYIYGLQSSKLSLASPMTGLIPLFSLVPVFFINHLLPTPLGFIGILTTIGGLYFLHFDHDTKHILSPFKAVFHNKGVLAVVCASLIWSVVISLDRLGIDNSSAPFFTAFFQLVWAIFFTPIAFASNPKQFIRILRPGQLIKLSPLGIFDAAQVMLQNIAFSLTNPTYVSIIGKTDILLTSLFAWIFLKEKNKSHLLPTLLIVIGIALITLSQQ